MSTFFRSEIVNRAFFIDASELSGTQTAYTVPADKYARVLVHSYTTSGAGDTVTIGDISMESVLGGGNGFPSGTSTNDQFFRYEIPMTVGQTIGIVSNNNPGVPTSIKALIVEYDVIN